MRVLLLIDSLGNGGAERQMALLATRLPAAWQARVHSLGGGEFEAYLRERGITVEVYGRRSRTDPLPVATLARSIMTLRPDVVHSWGWISTLAAGPLCCLLGLPLIDGTIRNGALRPEHLWLRRMSMACATTVVANSHAGMRAWGMKPAKARVVHNGFDWSRVQASSLAAGCESAPESPLTVVMTGRMARQKDFHVVISAARLLRRAERPYRFLLVGYGPQRDQLMAEATDLVTDGIMTFPPASIEVLEHVRQAHVGVLMTDPRWHQEGCSNAIMEYMACGLPVLCGESGGNREVVEDGKTGFVIAPADPQALAERIAYLGNHEDQRRAMGAAGRERIMETFSLERMVDDYVRIYEETLSG